MKKLLTGMIAMVLFAVALPASATTTWNVSGNWVFDYNYLGGVNLHDMTLLQDIDDNLSGSGGAFSGTLPYAYPWTITSGNVSGNTITLTADYDLLDCSFTLTGAIAMDGTMSGSWSDDCSGPRSGTWTTTSGNASTKTTLTVTIEKYVDGEHATASNASNSAFPMQATWNALNIGSGGPADYALDADGFNGIPTPYQAITSPMTWGADYSTWEVTGGSVVGASCATGQPFELVGYTWGDTLAEAEEMTLSATAPNFTGLTSDKVVIVWNETCGPSTPEIVSPAPNMCYTTAQLQKIDWTDSTGSTPISYQYEAYGDVNYTSLIYSSGWLSASEIPTPGTPEDDYYIRVRAKDNFGYVSDWSNGLSDPYKITVSNTFTMSAFLSPLNIGKSYKQGSTIPVKIQVLDACGMEVETETAPQLLITGPTTVVFDQFRYDSSAKQYISNWSTKVPTLLPTGTYNLKATLLSATPSEVYASVQLVK